MYQAKKPKILHDTSLFPSVFMTGYDDCYLLATPVLLRRATQRLLRLAVELLAVALLIPSACSYVDIPVSRMASPIASPSV